MGDHPPQGTGATAVEVRDAILDDATRFSGADIAAILTAVGGGTVFTATGSSTTTLTDAALVDVANNYLGQMAVPLAGDMALQGRYITIYNGTTQITVDPAWAADPGLVDFIILPTALGVLYDALIGTTGLAAWPGGAVPGAGVNVVEVIEQISDDLTEGKLTAFKRTYTYTTVSTSVSSAAEQDLATSGEVAITFPTGATKLRAIVVASLKVNNQTAAEHNIGVTLQNDINNAGWADLVDLTANMPLTLPDVDATADAITLVTEVDAFNTGDTVEFRFQVDSDNAGEVHYTCTFVVSVEYDFQ